MISVIWAIIGILMITAEFFIPGLVIIFFGIGALITSLLTLIPGIGSMYALQAILFIASSLGTIGIFRKKLAKVFKGKMIEKNTNEYIGKKAVVIEDIDSEKPGRIKLEGTTWKAITYDEKSIKRNSQAEILGKEGMTFLVTKSFLD